MPELNPAQFSTAQVKRAVPGFDPRRVEHPDSFKHYDTDVYTKERVPVGTIKSRIGIPVIEDTPGMAENVSSRIRQYADKMEEGVKFPPVVAARDIDGGLYSLDGYHREHAAYRAGLTHIDAFVRAREPDFHY